MLTFYEYDKRKRGKYTLTCTNATRSVRTAVPVYDYVEERWKMQDPKYRTQCRK